MEALANRVQKAVMMQIGSNRDRCKRVLIQVEGANLAPPSVDRFRRLGKPLVFRSSLQRPRRRTETPGRRIARLQMRSDYADGGMTMARALDEGCPLPESE